MSFRLGQLNRFSIGKKLCTGNKFAFGENKKSLIELKTVEDFKRSELYVEFNAEYF